MNYSKSFLISFLIDFIFVIPVSHAQQTISGVKLPATIQVGDDKLMLNGGGIREKWWIDIYVGGLYVVKKSNDSGKIVDEDKPMAVRLHIISSLINRDKMVKAIREGFEKSTGGNTQPIQKEIDALLSAIKEELKIDDVFDLIYEPGKGVSLLKNGKQKVTVKGMEFKKALFGIWLGSDPVDKDLKKGMLGGSGS